jgi:protein required for attachment to host cells
MSTTWVLVAHRSGARLFENAGRGKGLSLVQDLPHPEGRLKSGEINSDRPGRSYSSSSGGGGMARHGFGKDDATVEVAAHFARELAGLLDRGRTEKRFDQLVLVAEPSFLGNLRASLTTPTAAAVSATLDKDLGQVSEHDLPKHLGSVIAL